MPQEEPSGPPADPFAVPARFTGKVAVVTGAGSGLGRATAVRLAREGAAVAVLDLNQVAVDATREIIVGEGGSAGGWTVDVSDPAQVRSAVDGVAASLGRPEVLVNCAGICRFDHTTDVAYETWRRTIDVNLGGTFLMCQAVLPHLLDGGGTVVNVASNAGLQGVAYAAAYCASKGGVAVP
jgi:NAD(P)-dependent dehydrogenase (short-subunit alcohol dehydrogenase family)